MPRLHIPLFLISVYLQAVPKPEPVPDVIEVEKKPGVSWDHKEQIWYRTDEGISEGYIAVPGTLRLKLITMYCQLTIILLLFFFFEGAPLHFARI